MKVLSHRGYWKLVREQNCAVAFERSFRLGFGTETDLRDLNRSLVVSHDPPFPGCITVDDLLTLHSANDPGLPLALNVKSDGLQSLLRDALLRHRPADAFVFDMSIPDTIQWLRCGIAVFVRQSDIEPEPVLYEEAAGIWLDSFQADWWGRDTLCRHLDAGKRVCVVSPELHGRDPRSVWDIMQHDEICSDDRVMLCTDRPEDAAETFSREN